MALKHTVHWSKQIMEKEPLLAAWRALAHGNYNIIFRWFCRNANGYSHTHTYTLNTHSNYNMAIFDLDGIDSGSVGASRCALGLHVQFSFICRRFVDKPNNFLRCLAALIW